MNIIKAEDFIHVKNHLKSQFECCSPVLFTGAGFSYGAKNFDSENLPTGYDLTGEIWKLLYPDADREDNIELQDIYQLAVAKKNHGLKNLLTKKLTINPDSLLDYQMEYFKFPWKKVYSLNVDNMADAVRGKSKAIRNLIKIDATSTGQMNQHIHKQESSDLQYIYLNGSLDNYEKMTFSKSSYSRRLLSSDPWYVELINDLTISPIVFVGSQIDEPSFWLNIEERKHKGRKGNFELRPKSYLVIPTLSRAKQELLSEYNIFWIPMTAEEFYKKILETLTDSINIGLTYNKTIAQRFSGCIDSCNLSDILSRKNNATTDYLRGHEPEWTDFGKGKVADRVFDKELINMLDITEHNSKKRFINIISGTAGSGKSTCLKKLSLHFYNEGKIVYYFDKNNMPIANSLVNACREGKPYIVVIDDADIFGMHLSVICSQLIETTPCEIIVGIRGFKKDSCINTLIDKHIKEHIVPNLHDDDISSLIQVLKLHNRLGVLETLSEPLQFEKLREKCGRQLLVAMIEATSGRSFNEKIREEFSELDQSYKIIYGAIAVSTALRHFIDKSDLFLVFDDADNNSFNILNNLCRSGLVSINSSGSYLARHRVISEKLLELFKESGILCHILVRLSYAHASKCSPSMSSYSNPRSYLLRIMNHDFLKHHLGVETSRKFYNKVESFLSDDFGYWLQRGSLEVETDNLSDAETFLNNARGKAPNDRNTLTECAYLYFKKAIRNPESLDAQAMIDEAITLLTANITARGSNDPHSFHVYLHNMLEWILVKNTTKDEKVNILNSLKPIASIAIRSHPANESIRHVCERMQNFQFEIIKTVL